MDTSSSVIYVSEADVAEKSGPLASSKEQGKYAVATNSEASTGETNDVPMKMKLFAVLLVTAIGFGSHWSSGVTGAMKSTVKKVRYTGRNVPKL
jgi:hypothetical protein